MQHLLPKWKGRTRQARVKAMLGDHNDNVYAQEAQGLIVETGETVFNAQHVSKILTYPLQFFKPLPRVVYTFIDPHGGGTQSSQAALSMVRDGPNYVVLTLHPPPLSPAHTHTHTHTTPKAIY